MGVGRQCQTMETSSPEKRSSVHFIISDTAVAIGRLTGARMGLKVVIIFKVRKEVHRTPDASYSQTHDTESDRISTNCITIIHTMTLSPNDSRQREAISLAVQCYCVSSNHTSVFGLYYPLRRH